MKSWLMVGLGSALGAWARWGLSAWLNSIGMIPLGTLMANAIGGFLMGIALALFQTMPQLSHEWRLFIAMGFLGGLTTFSTFSAQAFVLLQKQAYMWVGLHIFTHVVVSILLTIIGYWCVIRWQGA
ncbi:MULTISPECIES: fluoride efflux transporter CrcB [unclassified Methylophilus]|uniref:fluoride efflux transporter CrcB n=1 Tax=unclassified Methylophilus TaxID=2630143 RepID=UPI00188ED956|nr:MULTISPECIES: fluoride efflux transporter CrcB [unclassified Methylophilus]MBF4988314.1 fluoride efflux transporter CrcB [Methylophilus sp. 14]MBF4990781.1 fluoride efflux transporter CrcB [Methylophilus sp. QUAN]